MKLSPKTLSSFLLLYAVGCASVTVDDPNGDGDGDGDGIPSTGGMVQGNTGGTVVIGGGTGGTLVGDGDGDGDATGGGLVGDGDGDGDGDGPTGGSSTGGGAATGGAGTGGSASCPAEWTAKIYACPEANRDRVSYDGTQYECCYYATESQSPATDSGANCQEGKPWRSLGPCP